jgi:hypothetical protein
MGLRYHTADCASLYPPQESRAAQFEADAEATASWAMKEIARLREENAAKDRTITALADALALANHRLKDPMSTTLNDQSQIESALRLAGRIR